MRKARAQQALYKVGTVRGQAYYAVRDVQAGRTYVAFCQLEQDWEHLGAAEELGSLPTCTIPSVAKGRARLLAQESTALSDEIEALLGQGHAPPWLTEEITKLRQQVCEITGRAKKWLEARDSGARGVHADVRTQPVGWTADELMEVLAPLYPQVAEVDAPRKLIPLLARAIRRIPNPEFVSRRSGDPRTASEFLFERTDTLVYAALQWGGPESRLQAMFAKNELGRLRQVACVLPGLRSVDPDVRLRTVACLAFLDGEKGRQALHEAAVADSDAGVREAALWAYGFAGAEDVVELARDRQANDPHPRVRRFAERVKASDSGQWWGM